MAMGFDGTLARNHSLARGITAALLALSLVAINGCCGNAKIPKSKAAWASEDMGLAVVDVTRRLPNGQQDNGVVRGGPAFSFPKVASLPSGTSVNVIENRKTDVGWWSRVQFNGNQEGWMHQDILLKGREGGVASSVSGSYESVGYNATCTLTDSAGIVKGTCTDSTSMSCNRSNGLLLCTWQTTNKSGGARLVQTVDGALVGSFGYGRQDSGGGSWSLLPR